MRKLKCEMHEPTGLVQVRKTRRESANMSKPTTQSQRDIGALVESLKSRSGDAIAYRQMFDTLNKTIPFAEGFLVASTPRGGVQVVQPTRVPDVLVKAYAKEFHQEDRATWQAMKTGKPVRGTDAWGKEYEQSRYLRDFMLYNCNLYHMLAVPLKGPVFAGYAGAIHLYRYREQGPFTDAEISKVAELAKSLNEMTEQQRQNRRPQQCIYHAPWTHGLEQRQFVFDAKAKCVYNADIFAGLDDRLRQQMTQHCQHRLGRGGDTESIADRLQTPDSRGDLWTFRVVTYRSYPALGNSSAYVFFCLQPEACDWATIRPTDFNADQEMVRLIPALRFMQQEFHRSPSLGEIARQVHLSPFHFHRRFTELLGLTPKHFLLECQIFEAKRQLMARQKDLSQIAADCGFAHQSHFTSRFKQATGLTPTRWRRVAQDLQRNSVG